MAKFLFSVLITALFSQTVFAQQGKWSYAVFGGYSIPMAELKKTTDDIYGGNDYAQKTGFNLGGTARYTVDKKGNLDLAGSIIYNGFKNSPDGFGADTRIYIFSLDLGAQYNFMPHKQFNPYVKLDLANNFIGGSTTSVLGDAKQKSEYRFGLQFGAGLEIGVSDKVGILIGANYDLANLIGKSSDTTFTSSTDYPLNDGAYTLSGFPIAAKSISYIQLYTGVTIYLDRRLRK